MGSKIGSGELRLAGGSAQLLTYTLDSDWARPRPGGAAADEDDAALRREQVGRRPPKKV